MKRFIICLSFIILSGIFLACESPIEEDTTPPVVSIQSPLSGEIVNEIVIIVVATSDNKEIREVEYYIDDSLHISDAQAPYEYSWNTSTLEDSSQHTIKVITYDTSDNSTESQPILVTVNNISSYPTAIDITSIIFENGTYKITWNKSFDSDFDSYRLEKSLYSTMEEYTEIYTSNEIADTIYTDIDISPLEYQYYRIVVTDTVGLEVKGQIISSSLDPLPSPLDIISVSYSLEEMNVMWEQSHDNDFYRYILVYSSDENGLIDTIETFYDQSVTSYNLTEFDPTQENWFRIIVTDTLGQYAIGNGLSNSIDLDPTPIHIASVTYDLDSMLVIWNQSPDDDFISYRLMYAETESGARTSIATFIDKEITAYSFENFDPNSENWFWIEVTDYWGLTTIGNGKSNNVNRNPYTINVTSVTYDHDEMTVNWNSSSEYDFASYEIYYSDQQSGDKSSLSIIYDKSSASISYPTADHDPTTENWFWIEVTDYWDLSTMGEGMSNQIEVPPTQSNLTPIFYYDNSFQISWSENIDEDFLSYDLYESIAEDMTSESLIYSTSERNAVEFVVSGVNDDEVRYYHLVVNDTWGFSTQSSVRIGSSYQKIVYIAGGGENRDIYLMNPDGEDQINLTSNPGYYDFPKWSPDGMKIFYLYKQESTVDLFAMNLDGTNQINISNLSVPLRGVSDPDLSTDGTKITFSSSFEAINGEVYVIDTDGSNLTRLTNNSDAEGQPRWSPDGSMIVFSLNGDIYIINPDGTDLTNLTNSPWYENLPVFSPDGSKIAYILYPENSSNNSDVYTMNIDGSNTLNVSNYTSSKAYPNWSPDGQYLLFSEWVDDSNKWDIIKINPDGTVMSNLTNSIESDQEPVWSGDGSKIFFTSTRDGNSEIYLMNPDGSNQLNLTNTNENDYHPQFQPRE